ncbi:MAG: DMT family transporter [Candidatus Roizmanbacteria bacterium]|nr:DMT family transporter [Candidatus Roizmanbacteria bacterium]
MNKGIQLALGTALISGFSIFLSKILVSSMDPVVFTTLKNIFVALVLSLFVFRASYINQIKKLNRSDWVKLILIGIVGGGIPFALFFTGLSMTSAGMGAILHKTLFIWIALLAIPFLREKLSLAQMVGYVLVLWGVLWTTGIRFTGGTGELMVLAATILWALENVIAKKTIQHVPGIIVAWGRMFFGSLILLGVLVVTGKMGLITEWSPSLITAFLVSSILLVGYVITYYTSLQYIPVTTASSILVLSAPITALLQFGLQGQGISPANLQSYVLLVVGVAIITYLPDLKHIFSKRS